jgi:4-diphosphocytidyl-2-C-methyl-D-erythritol kinase
MSGAAARGRVQALAPAKVNPWLFVLGRGLDGWHELDLGYLALDLADLVEVEGTRDGEVAVETTGPQRTPDLVDGPAHLAWRGARLALDQLARRGACEAADGARVRVDKRIPSQSGLGGGSSDAAAAWLAVRHLHGAGDPDAADLDGLAALGSDCAFFARTRSGCARGRGRGERLSDLSAPALSVALLTPDIGCPTPLVYRALGLAPGEAKEVASELHFSLVAGPTGRARNDLEAAALAAVPGLRAWRATLDAVQPGAWFLSGSGSSFASLHAHDSEAHLALERASQAIRRARLVARLAQVAASGPGARVIR